MAFDEPAQVRLVADWIASSGDPIGATTIGPLELPVRLPNRCASFGAVKVTTAFARKAPSTEKARESASQPEGRSTATIGVWSAFTRSRSAAATPRSGGLNPVPTMASRNRSAESSRSFTEGESKAVLSGAKTGARAISSKAVFASPFRSAGYPSSRTLTAQPTAARLRAATKPSPPLLPLPQRTAMCRHSGNSRRTKRATAAPALCISPIEATPNCFVVT